jgi:hypothetical protein
MISRLVERFDIAQFRDPGQEDRTEWPSEDDYNEILNSLARSQALLVPSSAKEKVVQFEASPAIDKEERIQATRSKMKP